MQTEQDRLVIVFNEWAKRFALDPEGFDKTLDKQGRPVVGYGKKCVAYLIRLEADLVKEGLLEPTQDFLV